MLVTRPSVCAQVLRDGDVHLLGLLRIIGVAVGLGIGGLPVPCQGRVDHGERPMGPAERKELAQLGTGLLGIADQKRLALPEEPELAKEPRLVEVVVESQCRGVGLGVDHEGDLRRPPAFATHLAEHFADLHVDLGVGQGVGRVEDQGVDAGVGQQAGVSAQDPRVVAAIVAVERLAPVMCCAERPPERRIGFLQRLGVLGQDPRHVERRLRPGCSSSGPRG